MILCIEICLWVFKRFDLFSLAMWLKPRFLFSANCIDFLIIDRFVNLTLAYELCSLLTSFSFFLFIFFLFCGTEDWTQDLLSAKQVLYHWPMSHPFRKYLILKQVLAEVPQASLRLGILLSSCDYRCAPSYLTNTAFSFEVFSVVV